MERAYAILCGVLGGLGMLAGLSFFVAFFRYHLPDSAALESLPVGPNGAYWMGFAGSALIAWSACLVGVARRPHEATWIATASAWGFALCALQRMMAWLMGDYAALGSLLRVEAAFFLLLALALVWLKPRRVPAAAG